ncbi:hypothetical protein C4D60_Mb06t16610 [Musa balbisiana]|uniref:Uncharacterized protein n=1 Tax=Musa balbisiana TaxID=52838 RepID=A0A4S8IP78_MUSBA|nr:hypothetical protein C4D60_Mb06t16610 [Musa balbisiana]
MPSQGGRDAGDCGRGHVDDPVQGASYGDGVDEAYGMAVPTKPTYRLLLQRRPTRTGSRAASSLFILQAAALRRYDAPLSLTSSICFVRTLQAIVVTFVMEHNVSVWHIGLNMDLLAAAYAVSLLSLLYLQHHTGLLHPC